MTPEAETALIARALAVTTCRAEHVVCAADPDLEDAPAGVLVCSMAVHDGIIHYDPVDGVLWAAAQPGMTRDQAAAIARRLAVAV